MAVVFSRERDAFWRGHVSAARKKALARPETWSGNVTLLFTCPAGQLLDLHFKLYFQI